MKNLQTNSFKNINHDRNKISKNFSQKKRTDRSSFNDQRILFTKSSNSVLLTKQSVAAYEEKSVQNTEKILTDINLSKINEDNSNANITDIIKGKVNKIFNNFAKYSKEEEDFILSQQALIKILRYINILDDKKIKLFDIDVILKKVCVRATKLNKEQFLDFVAHLSYKLDPVSFLKNSKETIYNIIQVFFDPFVEFLENQNFSSADDTASLNTSQMVQLSIPNFVEKFEIDQKMISLITSVYSGIKEVYQLYFHFEINDYIIYDKILKESLNSYINFCKDFEVYPYLLNMNQIVCYWNYINGINSSYKNLLIFDAKKDLGKVFTLNKFIMMIIHFSVMTFSKINNGSQNLTEFVNFLEKLEASNGGKNLERKSNKPHMASVSILPSKEVIKQITQSFNLDFTQLSEYERIKTEVAQTRKLLQDFNGKNQKNIEISLKSILTISPEVISRIEEKLDVFKETFLTYSKLGDKLNFNKINFTGFLKFLKDCDLIYYSNHRGGKSDPAINPLNCYSSRKSLSPMRNILGSPSQASLRSSQRATNSILVQGKLIESEAFCIFCSLTGHQNFDNSIKIKNQFNQNKGYTPLLGETTKFSNMLQTKLLTTNKSNVPMKMDFNLFIKSFEIISRKLYPKMTQDEACLYFIENNVKGLINQKEEELSIGKRLIIDILQEIRKEEIIDLIKDIHHVVMLHYENYCNNMGYMDFDQFFNFYRDFGLFPEILNVVQIKNIFFALSDILHSHFFESTNKVEENKNNPVETEHAKIKDYNTKIKELLNQNEFINFDLLLDSLAVSSKFIRTSEEFDEIDRILYLVEKMNQSKGISASQKRNGSTFNSIKDFSNYFNFLKNKYPNYFIKKQRLQSGNKMQPIKFNKIFEN